MSEEKREARRQKRNQKKDMRKRAFSLLSESIDTAGSVNFSDSMSPRDKLKAAWPFIKPALEFVAVLDITKERADKVINEVIDVGDRVFEYSAESDHSSFLQKFSDAWPTIEAGLEIAKLLASDRIDRKIDLIIGFGEMFLEN